MGYRIDSPLIHHWMGCESNLSRIYTTSNGGWVVSQHGAPQEVSHYIISLCLMPSSTPYYKNLFCYFFPFFGACSGQWKRKKKLLTDTTQHYRKRWKITKDDLRVRHDSKSKQARYVGMDPRKETFWGLKASNKMLWTQI